MGGINFGWFAVWVLSPDWLSGNLEVCEFCQPHRWSRCVCGSGVRAVSPLCNAHPDFWLTNEEKHGKPVRGNRKALGWSAPNAIRFVDLAIAGEGPEWPAGHSSPWLSRQAPGSTLVQRTYLPNCLTLRQSSQSGLWFGRQTAEHADPRVPAGYLRTRGHQ